MQTGLGGISFLVCAFVCFRPVRVVFLPAYFNSLAAGMSPDNANCRSDSDGIDFLDRSFYQHVYEYIGSNGSSDASPLTFGVFKNSKVYEGGARSILRIKE